MKIVRNKYIPFQGFKAMCLWPFLFVRSELMSDKDIRHELIHGEQQKELLIVGIAVFFVMLLLGCGWLSVMALPMYFWVYGILYVWELIFSDENDTYKANPLEKEAYFFEGDESYISRRRWFGWWQFVKGAGR